MLLFGPSSRSLKDEGQNVNKNGTEKKRREAMFREIDHGFANHANLFIAATEKFLSAAEKYHFRFPPLEPTVDSLEST